MNAMEFTTVARRTEDVESTSITEPGVARQPAPGTARNARLRYALLAGIALLSAWLAFTIRDSINEIDAQVEMIRTSIVSSPH